MLNLYASRVESLFRKSPIVVSYSLNAVNASPSTGHVEGEVVFVDRSRLSCGAAGAGSSEKSTGPFQEACIVPKYLTPALSGRQPASSAEFIRCLKTPTTGHSVLCPYRRTDLLLSV